MTVAEMIEALSKMPQDKRVVSIGYDGYLVNTTFRWFERAPSNIQKVRLDSKDGEEVVVIFSAIDLYRESLKEKD